MTLMEDFLSEMRYSSIVLCTEDVVVPLGTYKDCLKICLFFISKNFNVRNEKLRVGYIWLARGKGIIKEKSVEMVNYLNPLRMNRISAVRFWQLTKMEKTQNLQK